MATDNQVLERRIFDEVWNGRHVEILDELLAPEFIFHDPQAPLPVKGAEAYKQFVKYYVGAFPDLQFTIEHQMSDSEGVMTRWSCTGTHKGDLRDIPATGRPISLTGMTCSRISGGKFVEAWSNWDTLGMLQQLGAIPAQQPVEQAA